MLIAITSALTLTVQFLNLILLTNVASILPYIYTVFAFVKFHVHTARYRLFFMCIAFIAFIYLLWGLFTIGFLILASYVIVFLIGTAFYYISQYKTRKHI